MPGPSWTHHSKAEPAPLAERTGRLIVVVVAIALLTSVAFNVAIVGNLAWLLLAAGLGFFYGFVASVGVVSSALLVLVPLGRHGWSATRVALATVPGWLIAMFLVRVFGSTYAPAAIDFVVTSLLAVVAAAVTGWVVVRWDQQLSKR